MATKFVAPILLGAMVMGAVATTDVAAAATFNPALTTQHAADAAVTPVWWHRGWGWHPRWGWGGWGYHRWGWRGHRWCYWHPRACHW